MSETEPISYSGFWEALERCRESVSYDTHTPDDTCASFLAWRVAFELDRQGLLNDSNRIKPLTDEEFQPIVTAMTEILEPLLKSCAIEAARELYERGLLGEHVLLGPSKTGSGLEFPESVAYYIGKHSLAPRRRENKI